MESRVVVDENNTAKRLSFSKGDKPGKPEWKTRRLSRNGSFIALQFKHTRIKYCQKSW